MNKILSKNRLTDQVFSIEVEAPLIARSYKAGNFVIIRVEDKSQRLPLTVTKVNPERGSVTVVVKASNPSNARLAKLSVGDAIADIVGPLGSPAKVESFGTVLFVCNKLGSATALPIMKALKQANNRVLALLSAEREEKILMLEDIRKQVDVVLNEIGRAHV